LPNDAQWINRFRVPLPDAFGKTNLTISTTSIHENRDVIGEVELDTAGL
jgi:hypothetical protein